MNILSLFHKYKVITKDYNYDFLDKTNFLTEISWVYDLLNLIPLHEQTSREDSVFKLPEGLIREVFELFKRDETLFLDWITRPESGSMETYYAGLIHDLFEYKYIVYTHDETLADDLKFYEEEAQRMIEEDLVLANKFLENKDKIKVPKELSFLFPYLSLVDKNETVESFIQNTPSEFIDLTERMLARSSGWRKKYVKKSYTDLIFRIKILNKASTWYMDKLFSKYFN